MTPAGRTGGGGRRGVPRPRRPSGRDHERGHAGVGGEQVEGRQAVREALAARRRRVREVWMATELKPAAILDEIADLARRAGVPVRLSAHLETMAQTDAPQGVLARADPLPAALDDDLLSDRGAFLVALDGVTDPGNLGAILRSAEGAGATGIILPRRRSVHVTPAVTKAAAGAVEHLPITLVPGIPATLERARRAGVWTVGLDERGDTGLFSFQLGTERLLLTLGGEGRGLSRLARERCDVVLRIPMLGRLSSLNVATAAALACYEVARLRLGAGPPA
jgi:23S rRNA (guanosine2251-2'-O)-methyltransferase